ncbi:MAG: lysophospholipase L1-like esterase [Planctomycetota bacterium]|jgi:lysophospholipase L1-like esterase
MRRLLIRGVLVLVSSAIAILVAELAFRVHHFGWKAVSLAQMRSVHPLGQSGMLRPLDYDRPRYGLKPGLKTIFKMADFETNSRGLRDREYALQKPDGVYRIAVIGDSFTMGSGVPIEQVFHSVVETELNRGAGERQYEVLNFGVGGYGIRDYIGVLQHQLPAYDPDLVLICLCGNDRTRERKAPPKYREKPEDDYSLRFNLIDFLRRTHGAEALDEGALGKGLPLIDDETTAGQRALRTALPLGVAAIPPSIRQDAAKGKPVRADGQPKEESKARPKDAPIPGHLQQFFAELHSAIQSAGVPAIMVGLAPHRQFEQACRDLGLEYTPVGKALEGGMTEQYWIFKDDKHPNAAANELYAQALLKHLKASEHLLSD